MEHSRASILTGPTLFYDGTCGFCAASVQWVLRYDRQKRFLFARLQSELAEDVLRPLGVDPQAMASAILLYRGRVYTKSGMSLRTARLLGGWFRIAVVGYLVPGVLRNGVYDWFAQNRFRWFGQARSCHLPLPQERSRMLA